MTAMRMLHRTLPDLAAMLMGAFLSAESIASAAAPIINVNPSTDVPTPYWGFDEGHANGMVGWTFQLREPFMVTQVGWYAENADGLSRPVQVGLWGASSLIGDRVSGLIIPAGTNAEVAGPWRVVGLAEPLVLQPGNYALGGLDTSATTDVIKYVLATDQVNALAGSSLVIGQFFYAAIAPGPFGYPTGLHLADGLELGPMLFGTNVTALPAGSGLNILHVRLAAPAGTGILLTWPSGTLQEADVVTGPYTTVTNAASPYVISSSSLQKFYRLGP